jgi:hypothetical protein
MGRPSSFHEVKMADEIKTPEAAAEPARKRLEKGHVRYRVLKMGHGKIHTGEHGSDGPEFYKHGDEVAAPQEIASALEDRGFVEVL